MITREDIRLDVNIKDVYLLESALQHEKNNIGIDAVCKRYEENIEDVRGDLSYAQFCYLLGYLKFYDSSFKYDASVKLNGYVLSGYDNIWAELGRWDMVDLDEAWNNALMCYKERGFLFSAPEEVY